MNAKERKTMVMCMEFIARNINDEEVFEGWLINGVEDGDIIYDYIIKNIEETRDLVDEYYIENNSLRDLMDCFLRRMKGAIKSGGLYCDGITTTIG
jgi:hypothetical protein